MGYYCNERKHCDALSRVCVCIFFHTFRQRCALYCILQILRHLAVSRGKVATGWFAHKLIASWKESVVRVPRLHPLVYTCREIKIQRVYRLTWIWRTAFFLPRCWQLCAIQMYTLVVWQRHLVWFTTRFQSFVQFPLFFFFLFFARRWIV